MEQYAVTLAVLPDKEVERIYWSDPARRRDPRPALLLLARDAQREIRFVWAASAADARDMVGEELRQEQGDDYLPAARATWLMIIDVKGVAPADSCSGLVERFTEAEQTIEEFLQWIYDEVIAERMELEIVVESNAWFRTSVRGVEVEFSKYPGQPHVPHLHGPRGRVGERAFGLTVVEGNMVSEIVSAAARRNGRLLAAEQIKQIQGGVGA